MCVALRQTDRHHRGGQTTRFNRLSLSHLTCITGEARHRSNNCSIPSTAREHFAAQPRIISHSPRIPIIDHAFLPFRSNHPFKAQEKNVLRHRVAAQGVSTKRPEIKDNKPPGPQPCHTMPCHQTNNRSPHTMTRLMLSHGPALSPSKFPHPKHRQSALGQTSTSHLLIPYRLH